MTQFFILGIGLLIFFVTRDQSRTRKMEQYLADVAAEAVASSSSPFVLYLRSFSLDEVEVPQVSFHPMAFLLGWSLRALRRPALSQYVAEAVRNVFGPKSCVAIGLGDGDAFAGARGVFGPSRFETNDANWQSVVERVSEAASAIVVVMGRSRGIVAEIEHILERGLLQKTVFLLPDVKSYIRSVRGGANEVGIAAEARRDFAMLQSLFDRHGLKLPAIRREMMVVWIRPDGSLAHAQTDWIAPWKWPPKGSKNLTELLKIVRV